MPKPAEAAAPTRTDVEPSPALSILHNGPVSFEGRKVGALVTDGVDSELVNALRKTLDKEGATLEFIAPTIAGVKASDGSSIEANQTINGGPSVLYDAVALLIAK
jgi:catalase